MPAQRHGAVAATLSGAALVLALAALACGAWLERRWWQHEITVATVIPRADAERALEGVPWADAVCDEAQRRPVPEELTWNAHDAAPEEEVCRIGPLWLDHVRDSSVYDLQTSERWSALQLSPGLVCSSYVDSTNPDSGHDGLRTLRVRRSVDGRTFAYACVDPRTGAVAGQDLALRVSRLLARDWDGRGLLLDDGLHALGTALHLSIALLLAACAFVVGRALRQPPEPGSAELRRPWRAAHVDAQGVVRADGGLVVRSDRALPAGPALAIVHEAGGSPYRPEAELLALRAGTRAELERAVREAAIRRARSTLAIVAVASVPIACIAAWVC